MKNKPNNHTVGAENIPPLQRQRKSIRLKNYDYSQAGMYFVTICTQNRVHLFGEIVNDEMVLNDAGENVNACWQNIPLHYPNVRLHEFIIMPNHVHGIIEIVAPLVGAQNNGQPYQKRQPQGIAPTVGGIVGGFKSKTTVEYIKMVKQNILPPFNKRIWQRNYWEHIIRNKNEYQRIVQYINNNPKKWALDKLNGGTGNQVMEPPALYGQNIFCHSDEAWMI